MLPSGGVDSGTGAGSFGGQVWGPSEPGDGHLGGVQGKCSKVRGDRGGKGKGGGESEEGSEESSDGEFVLSEQEEEVEFGPEVNEAPEMALEDDWLKCLSQY